MTKLWKYIGFTSISLPCESFNKTGRRFVPTKSCLQENHNPSNLFCNNTTRQWRLKGCALGLTCRWTELLSGGWAGAYQSVERPRRVCGLELSSGEAQKGWNLRSQPSFQAQSVDPLGTEMTWEPEGDHFNHHFAWRKLYKDTKTDKRFFKYRKAKHFALARQMSLSFYSNIPKVWNLLIMMS